MSDAFSMQAMPTVPLFPQGQNLIERLAKTHPRAAFAGQFDQALREGTGQASTRPAAALPNGYSALNALTQPPNPAAVSNEAGADPRLQELMEAAKQMETQLTTFMLKSMDEASGEGGLLGNSSQGQGYFRDLFFREIAGQIVSEKGLGFAESLKNAYGINTFAP